MRHGRVESGGAEHRRSRSSATLNNSNNGDGGGQAPTGQRGGTSVGGDVVADWL